jgi:hypothetical protein
VPADNVIDDSVVRVSPDLTGFRRKLQRDLKAATADVQAKIRMHADERGFRSSVRAALRDIDTPELKVRLVADSRGFEADLRRVLRDRSVNVRVNTIGNARSGVAASVDREARSAKRAVDLTYRRVRDNEEKVQQAEDQAHATRLARTRGFDEAMDHLHTLALAQDARRGREAVRQAEQDRAAMTQQHERALGEETRRTKAANRLAEQEQRRSAAQRAALSRKAGQNPLLKATEANGLVDLGGSGVRPMNLLKGAATLLSPALVAMASSATLASTSVAALGAASIGTAGAVTAITMGFTRVREALTLRQQVRKEEQRTQTVARQTDRSQAAREAMAERLADARRSLRDATWGLGDAQRSLADAERDATAARNLINDAYREAADKVRSLREEISDLRLEEQQGNADIAAARERLTAVNNNFWATDLEKRQAALDVQKAIDRADDARRERLQRSTELTRRRTAGPDRSPEVLEARRRAADAERREDEARRDARRAMERREQAVSGLAKARRRDPEDGSSAATTAASSAAQDLQAQIDALSPAARKMYYWFRENEGALDGLRSKMESAVLPGFLTFMQKITDTDRPRRRGVKSTLDLMADDAARLGKIVGDTVGRLGELTRSKWFRRDMAKIGQENERSFTLLGRAAETAVRPISAILAASAPLFTRFSAWILDVTERFDRFIQRHVADGSLVKWFKDAGDELAKWAGIGRDVLTFLREIFSASLPTGTDLVSRLGALTRGLADWASSPKGRREMTSFFDYFRTLDYDKLRNFAVQLTAIFTGLKLFTFARKHPFWTLIGLLASADMDAASSALEGTAGFMTSVLGFVDKHPVASATLLAILTAARYGKSVSIGAKLLGMDSLAGKLDKLFGQKTAVMNVQAGVVNVNGVPGVGGAASTAGGAAAGLGAASIAAIVASAVGVGLAGYEQYKNARNGRPSSPLDAIKDMWSDPSVAAWLRVSLWTSNPWAAMLATAVGGSNPNPVKTGPDGRRSGGREFGRQTGGGTFGPPGPITPTPSPLMNAPAGPVTAVPSPLITAYKQSTEPLGKAMVDGLWDGYKLRGDEFQQYIGGPWPTQTTNSLKDGLGIKSPSRITYVFGEEMINGLWTGFVDRWSAVLAVIPQWISDNITTPLSAAFTAVGTSLVAAFTNPFATLASVLSTPVKTAMDWIDVNVIDKLNKALEFVGVGAIPRINMDSATVPKTDDEIRERNRNRIYRATGGPVPGFSPNPRADNIPAMLTADEYVHPVDTVKHYGVSFMDKVRRKEIPKYAAGGLVGDLEAAAGGPNIATRLAGGAFKKLGGDSIGAITKAVVSRLTAFVGADPGGGSAVGDVGVARIAEATARAMGATDKQLLALISAGVVESGMHNITHGDRDSLGFLQQRPSMGWGSPAQVTNVEYATRSFIRRAKQEDHAGQTPGQLAQAVQRSAYPDRYDKRMADAYAIINREAPFINGGPADGAGAGGPLGSGNMPSDWKGLWAAAKARWGNKVDLYSGVRRNSRTLSGRPSRHSMGKAIDITPTREIAEWIRSTYGARSYELITPWRDLMLYKGRPHKYSPDIERQHGVGNAGNDHIHWSTYADGGLANPRIPMRSYDTGGGLPPGVTLAVNGTGRTETIRTHEQEKALTGGDGRWMRLDPRDLALLAQHIAQATSRPIHMDGRKVAEIVNGYTYLPGGM